MRVECNKGVCKDWKMKVGCKITHGWVKRHADCFKMNTAKVRFSSFLLMITNRNFIHFENFTAGQLIIDSFEDLDKNELAVIVECFDIMHIVILLINSSSSLAITAA